METDSAICEGLRHKKQLMMSTCYFFFFNTCVVHHVVHNRYIFIRKTVVHNNSCSVQQNINTTDLLKSDSKNIFMILNIIIPNPNMLHI